MTVRILQGDCREVLRTLDECSVDSIVTDPPYELGFMGKSWDRSGVAFQAETWREALRVLKPGGHLLAFSGSRTYHRMVCAIEDAGFEIRDQIQWIYGSGFPKSKNLEGDWQGWGTALKPAHEPIVLARKLLTGTVAANVLAHGTGALNIDGCRVATSDNLNGGAYAEAGNRSESPALHGGSGMNVAGATTGRDFVQPEGRWPANVIHDGSAEVLAAFPQAPGQLADASSSSSSRKTQNAYGAMQRGSGGAEARGDTGSAARFFYCAKASRADRNAGCEHMESRPLNWSSGTQNPGSFQAEGTDKTSPNNHPTVKPTALMRYLCRLVTPPGGTVLDPFTGSGSTGRGAVLEGFGFIGIELDAEGRYIPIAEARIADAQREAALEREAERNTPTDLFAAEAAQA